MDKTKELEEKIEILAHKTDTMQKEIEEMKKFALITNEYIQKMQEHHIELQTKFITLFKEIKK